MYKVAQEIAKASQNLLVIFHPSYTIISNSEIKMYL